MWKPKLDSNRTGSPCRRNKGGAMAHRRAVGGRRMALATLLVLVLTFLMAGSVYVSNRVTGLRMEIARLESRRGFLEAGSARLLGQWNQATAPAVIVERASHELGLVALDEPDLVLVQIPATGEQVSRWRRLLDNVGGGASVSSAVAAPVNGLDPMVSLTPRSLSPAGGR
jgi:hypothetical protein